LTLLKAVAQAGGLTEWANAVQVLVKRKDPKTGKDLNYWYNLKKLSTAASPMFICRMETWWWSIEKTKSNRNRVRLWLKPNQASKIF